MIPLLIALAAGVPDDWPGFRGPSGTGESVERTAPTTWTSTQNVKWKAALPHKGNGSPVVSKGRVFVAGPEDEQGLKRSLFCFDRKDGRPLWTRTVDFGKALKTHATNPHSASTPAADGERVVVWHGSAGLWCYDYEGKELWKAFPGEVTHFWGDGVSPLIHQDRIFLNCGPGKRIAMMAIDLKTGKTLWETPEPVEGDGDKNAAGRFMGTWCTPILATVDGREQLICAMPTRVAAYDPRDGKILWWCEGFRHGGGDLAYSSPSVVGDTLVVVGGFMGPGFGIRLGGGRGDVTSTHRLWRLEKRPQSIGSGIVAGGHVYLPHDLKGQIVCVEPKTGRTVWSEPTDAALWGSIVKVGDLAYVTSQKGTTYVFRPSAEKYDGVAANPLGEPSNATPAVSDGELFIRTDRTLWCISR
jgi:outer membrane protein assembly factor BamB